MKCTFCGTENMPGRTHCIACGTPLTATEPSVQSENAVALPVFSQPIEPQVLPPLESPTPALEPTDVLFIPSEAADNAIQSLPPLGASAPSIEHQSQEMATGSSAYVNEVPTLPSLPSFGASPSIPEPQAVVPLAEAEITLPPLPPVSEPVAVMPEPSSWLNNDSETPSTMPSAPIESARGGESPRVNVQFNEDEVAEVAMPIHAESANAKPVNEVASSNPAEAGEAAPNHTGPWLAIIVLVAAIGVVIWLIYFVYNLLFGGNAVQNVPATNMPTSIVTSIPVATSTPVSSLSVNDTQREADIGDLRIALNAYYQGKQRYPAAGNYNSLLNALIGGGYLNRRIQDPAFPAQEYRYSVDSTGNSYDITVTFDTTASRLLGGSTSSVYHLRPQQ